ncbi:hypothetical protein JJJ17_07730 [Paracoccus caeni]|uniref:Uncharacterized protein n=1 Tax=Paracoccus caeni TaxID=657651 RepID=A0A934SBE8_9RHOB|nr:hypothetical protein [Paracoccus caeni]MBK4215810.1 hypothetical protein [Paracoccus caeni]
MGAREELIAIPDEQLRTGRIGQAALVFMDFKDAPRRWWTGFGDLPHAGHVWQGLGDLISISGIDTDYQVSARQVSFQLAATLEMLALALAAKSRVKGREVLIYEQLFLVESEDADIQFGQPLGPMFSLFTGEMLTMPWTAEGATKRGLTLNCEGLFYRRNQPPRGRWTDADQKARYPNDRGFDRLPLYANGYETRWRG